MGARIVDILGANKSDDSADGLVVLCFFWSFFVFPQALRRAALAWVRSFSLQYNVSKATTSLAATLKVGAKYALPPAEVDVSVNVANLAQPHAPSHVNDITRDICQLLEEFRAIRPEEYPVIFIDEVGGNPQAGCGMWDAGNAGSCVIAPHSLFKRSFQPTSHWPFVRSMHCPSGTRSTKRTFGCCCDSCWTCARE